MSAEDAAVAVEEEPSVSPATAAEGEPSVEPAVEPAVEPTVVDMVESKSDKVLDTTQSDDAHPADVFDVDAGKTRSRLASLDMTAPRTQVTLSWEGINFFVNDRQLLTEVSSEIKPGSLCAIMGPSGAGKTTLLNILAGRVRSRGKLRVTGTIKANGVPVDHRFAKRIAYVMQEDALFATQTPREAISFSAALRLPSTVSDEQREKMVEDMLVALNLTKCADTMIGSVMIKGISGGEKKRTAIGVELISNPEILFLDEPTSGLDSYAAFQVVKILKKLSASGRTIITTIHQPSSEVFDLFEETLLLTDGRLIYHDRVDGVTKYFAELGHTCPPHYNPADFVMFQMQQQSKEQVTKLADVWKAAAQLKNEEAGVTPSDVNMSQADRRAAIGTKVAGSGFGKQFSYLLKREASNLVRDKAALGARIGTTIFLNLIVGFTFWCAADWSTVEDKTNPNQVIGKINSQFGSIVQISLGGMFGLAQPMLLAFPLERPVFIREYATGTYGVLAYLVSKLLVEIPTMIAQSALMILVTYWSVGFSGNWFALTILIALLGLVSSSTALVISAVASNVQVAMQMTPLLFVPQMLFAGLFVPISEIPAMLRWAQYLCSLKYAVNLVVLVEFDAQVPSPMAADPATADLYKDALYGCHGSVLTSDGTCTDTTGPLYNNALLPRSDIVPGDWWLYVAILAIVFVGFRVMAMIALRSKARN